MKLTCDLCGSELQMNADSQGTTCAGCGMNYSLDILRQSRTRSPKSPTQTNTAFSAYAPTAPQMHSPPNGN